MCLVPKMPNGFDLPHGLLVSDELTADLSVFKLFLAQWIMAILSKRCKPDDFEPQNSKT